MVTGNGGPSPAAIDAEIDPGIFGAERLLLLAESALREASVSFDDVQLPPLSMPLYLGLPEIRPGFTPKVVAEVKHGLTQLDAMPIKLSEVHAITEGHASGFIALETAVHHMRQGRIGACLVGGVESYLHPDTMAWLDANRQLAGDVSRSGFIPGEGAGFFVLMTERNGLQFGLKPLACVRAVSLGKETNLIKTTDICLGEGLSATVRDALRDIRLPTERINHVICDINGERYRSEEWGFVCLRMNQYFDDPTSYESPAECWGDMGAASGPLFVMLVCQAFERGYSKGPRSLLWSSSESGRRAAAVLETDV
jgi:3-oxoacyl-[acyl-carrier-protein] synthase-1